MSTTTGANRERLFANLRALGADAGRMPEIPEELAKYIAGLTPEDLERILGDVGELERLGLFDSGRPDGSS